MKIQYPINKLFQLILFMLAFMVMPSYSLEHISMNKRLSELNEPLLLNMNVVLGATHLNALSFELVIKEQKEHKLLYIRMPNEFLLELSSIEAVTDRYAWIVVKGRMEDGRIVNIASFQPFAGIDSANHFDRSSNTDKIKGLPEELKRATVNTESENVSSQRSNNVQSDCTVSYTQGETLWRITLRHYKTWKVSHEGAILALYEQNPNAFYQGRLTGLKKSAVLNCPTDELIQKHKMALSQTVVSP